MSPGKFSRQISRQHLCALTAQDHPDTIGTHLRGDVFAQSLTALGQVKGPRSSHGRTISPGMATTFSLFAVNPNGAPP
jgi:hypothetical protein